MPDVNSRRVAFSGSGFLAPAFAGAIGALARRGLTIVEAAGTSGGSVAAALLAAGKSPDEIKAIAMRDVPAAVKSYNPLSLTLRQGINSGAALQTWLDNAIGDCTFSTAVIPVTIMATDIDAGVPFRFSRETTPDVRLADACRASTSVPVIWAPAKVAGRKLVDGGVCNNIPVNQLAVDDVPRLGFEIVDGSPAGSTKTLLGLLTQTIKTALSSNEGNLVAWAKASGADIVQINAAPYGAFDTALSAAEKEDLYERGLLAAAGAAK